MAVIRLHSEPATKCIADGIHSATGSDGPDGTAEQQSFKRIRKADQFNLAGETDFPDDFSAVSTLALETFVAGDCQVLTPDRKAEMWDDALRTAKRYWEHEPSLPNPFPKSKFQAPDMDCQETRVLDLATALVDQWRDAQS